jgi:hypothetical protein
MIVNSEVLYFKQIFLETIHIDGKLLEFGLLCPKTVGCPKSRADDS